MGIMAGIGNRAETVDPTDLRKRKKLKMNLEEVKLWQLITIGILINTRKRGEKLKKSGKEKEEPECDTDELKLFYLPFTKDWEQVMNRKFVSLRLEQDAWDLDAFDAKGDFFEMDDDDIQVTPDSFPLKFKFTRKKPDNSPSPPRGKKAVNTDSLKVVYVPLSEDWQEVMESKFAALRLDMRSWDMKAYDASGNPIDMGSDEVQLGPRSFPLEFKFR